MSAPEHCECQYCEEIREENERLKELVQSMIDVVNKWNDAYPTDIFTPHPKELEKPITTQKEYNVLITRVSAGMGRHIIKCLLEEFAEAKELLNEDNKSTTQGE